MSTLLEQAELAADLLGAAAHENGRIVCTAESLTGGMVSELITSVAGSSAWFDRGYVTYQISGKEEMIDVPAEVIAEFGVVSEPVAEAMARGALACSHADLSVALTGVAGLRKRRSARFVLGGQNAILPERSQQVCVPFTPPVIAEQCGWPLL